jgi:short chain dehydrogenase
MSLNLTKPQQVDIYIHKFLNFITSTPLAPLFWLLLGKFSPLFPNLYLTKLFALATFVLGFKRFLVRKVVWSGQVVLITGGASGIGRELVQMLIAKQAKVIVIDILPECGLDVDYYPCDLSNQKQLYETCQKISLKHTLTMLVNNAGIFSGLFRYLGCLTRYRNRKCKTFA